MFEKAIPKCFIKSRSTKANTSTLRGTVGPWVRLDRRQRGGTSRSHLGQARAGAGRAAVPAEPCLWRAKWVRLFKSLPDDHQSIKIPSILIKMSTVENYSMHSLGAWHRALPADGARGFAGVSAGCRVRGGSVARRGFGACKMHRETEQTGNSTEQPNATHPPL